MIKFTKLLIVASFCGALFFSSCKPSIVLTVKRPAEINLKDYKKIAMGSIVNSNGQADQHSMDIADNLTTKLFDSKTFEVVDRQNLQKILDEQKLGQSGLVDESSAVEIGKIIGSAVMVFGRFQSDKYEEETSKSDTYVDKEGKSHTTYYRKGKYSYIINLKLIDVKTSIVLAVRTVDGTQTQQTSASNATAPAINPDILYTKAITSVTNQFMKTIAPYDENVKATFEKDAKLPELEQALAQIKIGEWDTAVKILADAAARLDLEPKVKAKALYNYGLILMYSGKYDESINTFKEAMKTMPTNSKYQDAIVTAKSEKAKSEKLKEQQS